MKTRSLGFTDGMLYGMGRTAADGPKVLDWERAAELCAASDVQSTRVWPRIGAARAA